MGGSSEEKITIDFLDVHDIPSCKLPMIVLSDNLRSFFSAGIKAHEHGSYNHLMWMIDPGFFVSQNYLFEEVKIDGFKDAHRLKFWEMPELTDLQRQVIIKAIRHDLSLPWWKRRYDFLQILGKFIGADWLQVPGANICSDRAGYIQLADRSYNLKHPSPTEVNAWLAASGNYDVFLRYMPD